MTNKIDWTDPVQVLRAAADDMEKVMAADNLTLNMDDWYLNTSWESGEDTCEMCMAGAVLFNRDDQYIIKNDRNGLNSGIRWMDVPEDIMSAMNALNYFRSGSNTKAFCSLIGVKYVGYEHTGYFGELPDDSARDLIAHARAYADILEKELT